MMDKDTLIQEPSIRRTFSQKIGSEINRTFWIIVRTFSYLFIELPYHWLKQKMRPAISEHK